MRWSWPSFAGGAAFSALLALLLFAATSRPDNEPRAGRSADTALERPAPDDEGGSTAPDREAAADELGSAAETVASEPIVAGVSPDPAPDPRRERVRMTPRVRIPSADEWEASTDSPQVDASFSSIVVDSQGVRLSGGITFVSDSKGRYTVSFGPRQPRDALNVAEANAAADAHRVARGSTDETAIRDLLASERYVDRAAGLSLAARQQPPWLDVLLAAARDTEYPALRVTALEFAHMHAHSSPAVRDLVLESTRDDQKDVRESAVGMLSSYGSAGALRAGELLATGDYVQSVLPSLVIAVVSGGEAGTVLAGPLPPDAALALAGRVLLTTGVDDPTARAEAYAVASLVRPHLRNADVASTATFFAGAAASGFGDVLVGIAGDGALPGPVRLAAVTAALAQEATRAQGLRAFAGLVVDDSVSADALVAALNELNATHLADDGVQSALRRAASGHANPWVRAVAERRLRDAGYLVRTGLVIHSAVYGANGQEVDVTELLSAGITGGKLIVSASNDIAGDPNVGATKQLRVEYTADGVRRVRTVIEGQTLVLP